MEADPLAKMASHDEDDLKAILHGMTSGSSSSNSTPAASTSDLLKKSAAVKGDLPSQPDLHADEIKLLLPLVDSLLGTGLATSAVDDGAAKLPAEFLNGTQFNRLLSIVLPDAVNMAEVRSSDDLKAAEGDASRLQSFILSNMTYFVNSVRKIGCPLHYVDAGGLVPSSHPPADLLLAVISDVLKTAAKLKTKAKTLDAATGEEQQAHCPSCGKGLTPRFYVARGKKYICENCIDGFNVYIAILHAEHANTDIKIAPSTAASAASAATAAATPVQTPLKKTAAAPVASAAATAPKKASATSSTSSLTKTSSSNNSTGKPGNGGGDDDDDDIFSSFDKTKKAGGSSSSAAAKKKSDDGIKSPNETAESKPEPAKPATVDEPEPSVEPVLDKPAVAAAEPVADEDTKPAVAVAKPAVADEETKPAIAAAEPVADEDTKPAVNETIVAEPADANANAGATEHVNNGASEAEVANVAVVQAVEPAVDPAQQPSGEPAKVAEPQIKADQPKGKKGSAAAKETDEDAIFGSYQSPKVAKPQPVKKPSTPAPVPVAAVDVPVKATSVPPPITTSASEPVQRPFSPQSDLSLKAPLAPTVHDIIEPVTPNEDSGLASMTDVIVRQAELRGALEALESTLTSAATDQEQVQATETNLLLEWNSVMKTKDKMLRQEILSKQAQETPQANGSAAQRPRNPQNGTASASDDGCTIM